MRHSALREQYTRLLQYTVSSRLRETITAAKDRARKISGLSTGRGGGAVRGAGALGGARAPLGVTRGASTANIWTAGQTVG